MSSVSKAGSASWAAFEHAQQFGQVCLKPQDELMPMDVNMLTTSTLTLSRQAPTIQLSWQSISMQHSACPADDRALQPISRHDPFSLKGPSGG